MAALLRIFSILIIGAAFCCAANGQSCTAPIQFANSWNFQGVSSADFFEVLPNNQLILGGNANGRLTAFKTDSVGKAIWIKNYRASIPSIYGSQIGRFRQDPNGQFVASVSLENIMTLDTAGNPLKAVKVNINIPFVSAMVID